MEKYNSDIKKILSGEIVFMNAMNEYCNNIDFLILLHSELKKEGNQNLAFLVRERITILYAKAMLSSCYELFEEKFNAYKNWCKMNPRLDYYTNN